MYANNRVIINTMLHLPFKYTFKDFNTLVALYLAKSTLMYFILKEGSEVTCYPFICHFIVKSFIYDIYC